MHAILKRQIADLVGGVASAKGSLEKIGAAAALSRDMGVIAGSLDALYRYREFEEALGRLRELVGE